MSIYLAVEECVIVDNASLSADPSGRRVLNVRLVVGICMSSPVARKDVSIAVGAGIVAVGARSTAVRA